TFVPGRNLVFLTLAAAWGWPRGIHDLVAGTSQTDYSGYPDCRRDTLDALERTLSLGLERDIRIHTPLMRLSKKETVLLAAELGALEAMALTHTCYRGERPPCGTCAACVLRAKGFAEAGVPDAWRERRRTRSSRSITRCKARARALGARPCSRASRAATCGRAGSATARGRSAVSAPPISSAQTAPGAGSLRPRTHSPRRWRGTGRQAQAENRMSSAPAASPCCSSTSRRSPPCTRAASRWPSRRTGPGGRRPASTGSA